MSAQDAPQLESGTYEIIRNRLQQAGADLGERLSKLNDARKAVFGSTETKLLGSSRITTENNCTPRDIVTVGKMFLFGYNVQIGLRSQTSLDDVFSIYSYDENGFHPADLTLLQDDQFERDFQSLYKYYKKTVFSKFAIIGPHLFMKFRVGKAPNDFKTFKWLIQSDRLTYLDNRSDHEFHYPDQHEFEWTRCRRDWQRKGPHPHISIEDRLFVETIGGDLTIKIEDNTETGRGIYEEPVDNADQTLDDAEIYYAALGHLILLKIKPYDEKQFRYFVFNEKLAEVKRIDAIADACVRLPDDQGLIFSNGYYLATGEMKQFETQLRDMTFCQRISAANGEDLLFAFLNRTSGEHILLHYNLIQQSVATPILCHGFTVFEDGRLVFFRAEPDPQKHHALQIWQTPFHSAAYESQGQKGNPLFDIGNKQIVRCMAECQALLKLLDKDEGYANLYVDMLKKAGDILDSYFWIRQPECHAPGEALEVLRNSAEAAIDAFDKVNRIRKATQLALSEIAKKVQSLKQEVNHTSLDKIQAFVNFLARTRELRGEIIGARDLRYADLPALDAMDTQVQNLGETLADRCVAFLLTEDSLSPYRASAHAIEAEIGTLKKGSSARELEGQTVQLSGELELLIDIVSNLEIEDPTQTTRIIDQISAIFAEINQLRARIRNRQKELASAEGVAEFNAQLKLLDQTIINYLGLCDSIDKCESYLTKLMVTVEELEGRFSEFENFIAQLTEKREEIYNAFENRRLQLLESRNKRASALAASADRLLKGIASRVAKFETLKEIHSYFAADLMISKVRDIVAELVALEDSVKADDIQTQMKAIKEDAARQLKDRKELFSGDDNVIQLGNHRFLVNVQNLAPTLVMRSQKPFLHLTGTHFFQELQDEALLALRHVWDMPSAAEDEDCYRGEYLAFVLVESLERESDRNRILAMSAEDRLGWIQAFMGPRFEESYTKGVHDHDAHALVTTLLTMQKGLALLTTSPTVRAMAELFWVGFCSSSHRARIEATITAVKALASAFPNAPQTQTFVDELTGLMTRFVETSGLFSMEQTNAAAQYLFQRLLSGPTPPQSSEAIAMYRGFLHQLEHRKAKQSFAESRAKLNQDPVRWYEISRSWVASYQVENHPELSAFNEEVAVMVFCDLPTPHLIETTSSQKMLTGMKGEHRLLQKGTYHLDYHRFFERMQRFNTHKAPAFRQYQSYKHQRLEKFAQDLRLEEFKPRVLSSFVRNQLINDVYLPLIGSNLAKQIGTTGEDTRTDRMGMLLLVSPPGYGKTTLMEYIANRLGLVFMKINGPAIGHQVTSLDPGSAPNASAREELNKLNLALEMGDNIMLYVDDIQHCNPEFLQKFISLCDAQRKIEGVYNGRPRTYDLRGKKVCVVMAGNPYTESGTKFQIPDMLANRADTYNLGDMLTANPSAFKLSYIENCVTSNPILNRLAAGSQKDIRTLVRIAETGNHEDVQFESTLSPDAVQDAVAVLKKLLQIRDVVLKMNQAYIKSAAQEDAYRTEPPFKLQGSYRNMNKMAAQILPIMNDQELLKVIGEHYENEAQTLTTGAEANLLKFKHMMGWQTQEEALRWQAILETYAKRQSLLGLDGDDKLGQAILQLRNFGDGLSAIHSSLKTGLESLKTPEKPAIDWNNLTLKTETALSKHSLAQVAALLAEDRAQKRVDADKELSEPVGVPSELLTHAQHLYKTLRHQFTIMHHWLKPMFEMDQTQTQALEQLQDAVHTSLNQQRQLMELLASRLNIAIEPLPEKPTVQKSIPKKGAPKPETPPQRRPATRSVKET